TSAITVYRMYFFNCMNSLKTLLPDPRGDYAAIEKTIAIRNAREVEKIPVPCGCGTRFYEDSFLYVPILSSADFAFMRLTQDKCFCVADFLRFRAEFPLAESPCQMKTAEAGIRYMGGTPERENTPDARYYVCPGAEFTERSASCQSDGPPDDRSR